MSVCCTRTLRHVRDAITDHTRTHSTRTLAAQMPHTKAAQPLSRSTESAGRPECAENGVGWHTCLVLTPHKCRLISNRKVNGVGVCWAFSKSVDWLAGWSAAPDDDDDGDGTAQLRVGELSA